MKRRFCVYLCLIIALTGIGCLNGCKESKISRTTYDINVQLNDNCLYGEEEVVFFNNTDNAIKELKFNLFGNAFREGAEHSPIAPQYTAKAYPKGINYGDMQITSVKSQNQPLKFSICGVDQNVLLVELLEEVFPDEKVSVTITFSLNLAFVVSRTGINQSTINLANFYPILCAYDKDGFYECVYYANGDPFYSECADYKVSITLDSEYVVASSGKLLSEEKQADKTKWCYEISSARSFAFVLSKNFESIVDTSTGVEITYYFYNDENPLSAMETAIKSINLFNKKFGEYPYPTYAVVQTEFVQGGMEFPALVMISDSLEKEAYIEVVVHETAHQWWQTVVGNNEVEYGFLDEGLAEYSVVLFYENYPEYNLERNQLIEASEKTYKLYCSVYDKLFGSVDTRMIKPLGEFKGEYEYVNLAYIKPCIMYDYLRKTIGEEKFFKGLKKYYESYKFLNATPSDLVGIYEKLNCDTNGFFESFFEGKVVI